MKNLYNYNKLKATLKQNYRGCTAEECWNACSNSDPYGYVDVAIDFHINQETKNIFGDLLGEYCDTLGWIWACSTAKGKHGKYFFTGMDTGSTISRRTNLGKALKELFDQDIKQAKMKYLLDIQKEGE